MSRLSRLKLFVPHIIVVIALSSILVAGYTSVILQSATPTTPKATWAVNPLVISFSATVGSGSLSDSVTCSPTAGLVQLLARTSNPSKLIVSTSPSGLSCGSTPSAVVVTATCIVPAAQCVGSYNAQVQLRQPANYRNLPDSLTVTVNVA